VTRQRKPPPLCRPHSLGGRSEIRVKSAVESIHDH
jgi:hypothetical protein